MATNDDKTTAAFDKAICDGLGKTAHDWVLAGMPGELLHDLLRIAFGYGVEEGLKRSSDFIGEALNSGDGSYRP